jgi:hypothetical protein
MQAIAFFPLELEEGENLDGWQHWAGSSYQEVTVDDTIHIVYFPFQSRSGADKK